MTLQALSPTSFKDYELIDCGGFEKLERFGDLLLIRPEPQAVWKKTLTETEWNHLHHIKFRGKSAITGEWIKKKPAIPDRWYIEYKNKNSYIKLRLALTAFKHIGLFPEQAVNWDYLSDTISAFQINRPQVLNLFAYTGAASLIAQSAGAEVTHVDAIKQVVTWANENQQLSNLQGIRWIVEDALKFVKREIKRGKKYHGIILDPPAYGHGPNGEKWQLEEHIQEMVSEAITLLDEQEHFLLLNTYSLGFSSIIIENLIKTAHPTVVDLQVGELFLQAQTGCKLPLGVFGRFKKIV